jgi:DNA-binding winged helix-turn-helix (wHTH) protein
VTVDSTRTAPRSDVVLLRWPDEVAWRDELAAVRRARLILVAAGATPPVSADPLEDWMWESGGETELALRAEALARRVRAAQPVVDALGVLHVGAEWCSFSPHELPVARALVRQFGQVVPRSALLRAGWGDEPVRQEALNLVVHRIRQRVGRLGISVTSLRLRGFVMHWASELDGVRDPARPRGRA